MRSLLFAALAGVTFAASAPAQTIDRIKESGEVRLGYRTDAAPLSFADDAGIPAGYSVLLCAELAGHLGTALQLSELNVDFRAVTAENRFDMVANGEVDLLCGAASITLSRREIVDFSSPTFVDGAALILPMEASESFADLKGTRIGVRGATTTEQALRNSLNAAEMQADVVTFDSHSKGLDAIKAGDISAYFGDQSILHFLYATSGATDTLKVSKEILTVEKQGLALARGDSDFRLLVDAGLSDLYGAGVMEQIFAKSFPGAGPGMAMQALHLIAPTLP